MEQPRKYYLNEREILEFIKNDSDSVCSESSVELFLKSDSDTENFPSCGNNNISYTLVKKYLSSFCTGKFLYDFVVIK